jgi:N-acetylmuramoyl-L-alanine amidase
LIFYVKPGFSVFRTAESISLLPTRREFIKETAGALFFARRPPAKLPKTRESQLWITDRLSPLNRKRPRRPHTRYIVLHTTEGEEAGSLQKIVRFGEAHYVVSPSGVIYRIIDNQKIAKHAGRSMWEGRATIDNYSIGIEVIGYHNRDITEAQYGALRQLLKQLKSQYNISDRNILTHSMVAYGRPNRFHNDNHRGRKRCGMIFARPDVRAHLGLQSKPEHDLDVESGRLKIGDQELFSYLFARGSKPAPAATASKPAAIEALAESSIIASNWSAWNIARERYDHPTTTYIFPDGKRLAGNEIRDWSKVPAGTRVLLDEAEDTQLFEGFLEIGKDGDTSKAVAGAGYASASTIYFFPDGMIRTGAELKRMRSGKKFLENPPVGTRVLVGYAYGGYVKTSRPPSSIAGEKWNYPSTYYRYPNGTMISGDDLDTNAIPAGTLVFYQR